jgi:hypothetical protein
MVCLVEQLASSPAEVSRKHVGVHGMFPAVLIDIQQNWGEFRIATFRNTKINENALRVSPVIT